MIEDIQEETLARKLGIGSGCPTQEELTDYANLKLEALGLPPFRSGQKNSLSSLSEGFLRSLQARRRLAEQPYSPADQRIQNFLDQFARAVGEDGPQLPKDTFVLDRHGLARTLSLPGNSDHIQSELNDSYRISQGVLHNPAKDRRTTAGVFHVADWGLPAAADKKEVPALTALRLFKEALQPPEESLLLPLTAKQEEKAHCWVSLLLRPTVHPAIAGLKPRKSMEIRFFAPAVLCSNLDFVESIFGNQGDPYLPENDAGLDIEGWSGHTGCIVLAPHLKELTKVELGLPHISKATERQKRDGMCWGKEDEKYNEGGAFKITVRTADGFIVTAIADNYFGYSKKEVKTQISFSANLGGMAEEEHAGGALVFPSYDLGEEFIGKTKDNKGSNWNLLDKKYGTHANFHPEGYGTDKTYPDILYVPENVRISLEEQSVVWDNRGTKEKLHLDPARIYVLPDGYQIRMIKPAEGRRWRLRGTSPVATFCHKPCTVSGGGKSEISKSLEDAILTGSVFVSQISTDLDEVQKILDRKYGDRFRDKKMRKKNGRPILSPERSLGSVIKLLTPSPTDYSDEYNEWLNSIPQYIKDLVFIIKRLWKSDWEDNWRERFSVDNIDGRSGNELRYRNKKLATQFLRIGYAEDGAWRTFGLRKDFLPAFKLSMEDDITASMVLPTGLYPDLARQDQRPSVKFIQNCEYRFFQRPDDAIIRGYDKQAEWDISRDGCFLSNYEPLSRKQVQEQVEDTIRFEQYTEPMQKRLSEFASSTYPDYCASSAYPRIVNGARTKNPRYLQIRPGLEHRKGGYLAQMAARLHRGLGPDDPVFFPVNAVLPGHRNNGPDAANNIRPLCPFNPFHYLDFPELFMEFIASLTGKSPSTTGAGSEGALTKGPFNALWPIHDLNNSLVAFLLCDSPAFITSAGVVGPNIRVDHDISLLVPEVWSRLSEEERNPEFLIREGYLERCEDFSEKGEPVLASRLGYRITSRFVRIFFGRIFNNPSSVFTKEMLAPELQDKESYIDSIRNIVEAQKRVALNYFEDGSIELACPPLKALLHIMAYGDYNGQTLKSEELRSKFTRKSLLESDWYQKRLDNQFKRDLLNLERFETYIGEIESDPRHAKAMDNHLLAEKKARLQELRAKMESPSYREQLVGTIGCDFDPENSHI